MYAQRGYFGWEGSLLFEMVKEKNARVHYIVDSRMASLETR